MTENLRGNFNREEAMRLNANLLLDHLKEVDELLPLCQTTDIVFIADVRELIKAAGEDFIRTFLAWLWGVPSQSSEAQHLVISWGAESRPLVFAIPLDLAKQLIEAIGSDTEDFLCAQVKQQTDLRLIAVVANHTICYHLRLFRPYADDGQHRTSVLSPY